MSVIAIPVFEKLSDSVIRISETLSLIICLPSSGWPLGITKIETFCGNGKKCCVVGGKAREGWENREGKQPCFITIRLPLNRLLRNRWGGVLEIFAVVITFVRYEKGEIDFCYQR